MLLTEVNSKIFLCIPIDQDLNRFDLRQNPIPKKAIRVDGVLIRGNFLKCFWDEIWMKREWINKSKTIIGSFIIYVVIQAFNFLLFLLDHIF